MCFPAVAAGVAGGISALGSVMQGMATNAADKYQAQVATDQGLAANTAARLNEQQTYKQGDELLGRARAATAANGVVVNSGTALLNQGDIEKQTSTNVANQTYNAELATWQGQNQATLLKAEGSQAQTAGIIGAGGTLIGSAGQVASKWMNLNGNGSLLSP